VATTTKIQKQTQFVIQGTIRYYTSELNLFCAFLDEQGVVRLDEVTADVLRQYLMQLERTRNPGGIGDSFRAIRAMFLWYEEEFEPDEWKNPVRKVKAPKRNKQALPGVEMESIRELLKVCKLRRDRLIFLTLFDTGVRACELLALDVEDIDLVTGAVTVRHGKGDKRRTVFVGSKSRKELRAYLKEQGRWSGALFMTDDCEGRLHYGGLVRLVERRSKDAGIKPPGCHDFRRAFAVTMLRNGCDVMKLADMMGHSSLEVLRRYLHLVTDDLQEIHALAGPVDKL